MEIKTKISKWDLIKLKSFHTAEETINKKTTLRMEENICKQSNRQGINLQNTLTAKAVQCLKKTNNPIKKWAEDLNRHFSEEDIQMAKRHMKRCSTPLINREMQIRATIKYILTLGRMPIIRKPTNS